MRLPRFAIGITLLTATMLSGCANLSSLGARLSLDQEQAQTKPTPLNETPAPTLDTSPSPTPTNIPLVTAEIDGPGVTERGVHIAVTNVEETTPSENARLYSRTSGLQAYKMRVTLTNKTDHILKGLFVGQNASYRSDYGFTKASIIEDPNTDLPSHPDLQDVEPGATVTWEPIIQMRDPNFFKISIAPTFLFSPNFEPTMYAFVPKETMALQ